MNKDNNDLLPVIVGIVMSLALIVIWIMFSSFVNMYVWNNVLLYFFELPLITLVGGFGIGVLKDAFIKQIARRDEDMPASEYLLYSISYHVIVLLFAWIFTLLV
mgnify:CR=1 FL=1